MEGLSEKEIIKKIKDGEINYFEYFVKRYSKVVYFYVLVRVNRKSADAEDIIQNAFIKMYKAIDRFDENRPFYPYFFTIVKNETKEFWRRNKKDLPLKEEVAYEDEEESLELDYLLKSLRPEYKKVLKLYFEEGYSYREIAKKLGKPINTIKTLIRRAKKQVADNLRLKAKNLPAGPLRREASRQDEKL